MATGNPFTSQQAPIAMQMIAPDIAAQQVQLTRQQAIAQALMAQGMAPGGQTQMAGGYAIRNSPLEGVNKLAQLLAGTYGIKQADQKQLDLSQQLRGRMADILGGGTGAPPQPPAEAGALPGQLGSGMMDAADPTVAPQGVTGSAPVPTPQGMPALPSSVTNPAPPQPQQARVTPDNFNMANLLKGQVISAVGGEPAGAAYWKGMSPTDITRMGQQGGMTPEQIQAANAAGVKKANFIAPVQARAGSTMLDPNTGLPMFNAPHVPEGYSPTFGSDGKPTGIVAIPGGLEAQQASALATAQGKAQGAANLDLTQVYNPATQQMEYKTRGSIAAGLNGTPAPSAAPGNPSVPAPLRNNNPGALMPGGKLAQYPDMQTGLQALDNNLQSYGKQGVNTLSAVISKWAPPNENDTGAYIKDVANRLGIDPNAKIDLSNPAVRHALTTGIMLHENGPSAFFGGGSGSGSTASAPAGGVAASAPLGTTANANASQQASADTMKSSYAKLQTNNATSNAALESIDKMQQLAAKKNGVLTAGALGTTTAPLVSPEAAEYGKLHANLVTQLANQNGTGGTDAGRALTGESIPDYGKPKDAIKLGLETQANQIRAQQLKTQLLTPLYQTGDSKAYTKLENEFDQNVSPSMVPALTMQPGPARATALKSLAADPKMRSRLEWAANNGLLK